MKYRFMLKNRKDHSVARMAKVLGVSASGYHRWYKKMTGPPGKRELSDIELFYDILDVFRKSRGSKGVRRITKDVNRNRPVKVNHKRVERLMREHGLAAKPVRHYVSTTDSDHSFPVAGNLVSRDFSTSGKNMKMLSDTTYIKTDEGTLYAAGVLDLHGRMPVGLAMSTRNDRYLVMDALKDMLDRGCGGKGCIVHSDRGSTYASGEYRSMLEENGLVCSMSRKGNCWDNAPMESFWGKLKTEWLRKNYRTIEEAKRDVYEYVWSYYPYERPHSSNGYKTPAEYYAGT